MTLSGPGMDPHDQFVCTASDPNEEWFFCDVIISIGFFALFVMYFVRMIRFAVQNYFASMTTVKTRIVFLTAMFVKSLTLLMQAFGYKSGVNFSVFKFFVTDFPIYFCCCGYAAILYTWLLSYSSRLKPEIAKKLKRLKTVVVVYSSVCLFTFLVLFCARCVLAEKKLDLWSVVKSYISLLPDVGLMCLIVVAIWKLNMLVGMRGLFDLGNPDNYMMTMCVVLVLVTLVDIVGRVVLVIWKWKTSECGEMKMLLSLCYEAIGVLLPFGFLSVVDIFTQPVIEETSSDDNFGIHSFLSE